MDYSNSFVQFNESWFRSLSEEDQIKFLEEMEKLSQVNPLDYKPHDKQKTFHLSSKRIRLFCGGNRSGKTEAGCMEAIYHATGLYPDWFPQGLRLNRANRGRIIVESYGVGTEVLEPKLFKWLPKDLIRAIKRSHNGYLAKIVILHKTGFESTIEVMTFEQNDAAFEGWSGHWAWFDEPPPKEKYIATWRGLTDFGGRCWLTMTPIKEPWVYDQFVQTRNEALVDVFFVSIYDNVEILGKQFIDEFVAELPDEDKEARTQGQFRHLVGRVYKLFDPTVHVIPDDKVKLGDKWPVYFVLDPADRRPHHGIWFRVDPMGVMWVFDELVYKGTIEQTSKEILKREVSRGINPLNVVRILDPNKGETPSAVSGLRLKEEFAKWAVYFITTVNDDIALGHLAVSERLKYDKSKPIDATNKPKLYFLKDGTKECVRQIMSYVWDDWRGSSKDSKSQKEKPKDINKDMPDCLRYGVVFNPVFFKPEDVHEEPQEWNRTTGYRR